MNWFLLGLKPALPRSPARPASRITKPGRIATMVDASRHIIPGSYRGDSGSVQLDKRGGLDCKRIGEGAALKQARSIHAADGAVERTIAARIMTRVLADAKSAQPHWEVGVYRGASTGDDPDDLPSSAPQAADKALDHMVAALKILDATGVSPAIGARLDQTIDMLRQELAKGS